jgi:hypothetical protein
MSPIGKYLLTHCGYTAEGNLVLQRWHVEHCAYQHLMFSCQEIDDNPFLYDRVCEFKDDVVEYASKLGMWVLS